MLRVAWAWALHKRCYSTVIVVSKSLEKDFEMYAIGFLAGMFFVGVQLLQKYDMWARD